MKITQKIILICSAMILSCFILSGCSGDDEKNEEQKATAIIEQAEKEISETYKNAKDEAVKVAEEVEEKYEQAVEETSEEVDQQIEKASSMIEEETKEKPKKQLEGC